MADFLEEKRREINERIAQLKPLLGEYEALQEAAAALGGLDGGSATAAPSPARRGPGRPRGSKNRTAGRGRTARTRSTSATVATKAAPRRRAGRRKGSGERSTQALQFVTDQPGITVSELAAKMGIKQNYLYRVLPSLEQEGKVRKEGRGWHPKGAGASAV
jgi:hypothetical protein